MKTFIKLSFLLFVSVLMAAGCGKDSLNTGEEPVIPLGELGCLSFENWDLGIASDVEVIPTENTLSSITRAATEAPDTYIVKITNSKKEVVFNDTYAALKAKGLLELPQDTYAITAESPNYASIPTAAWETPAYYGKVAASVIKRQTSNVSNLICRLSNIKTSVTLSADLNNLFKPDDAEQQLSTTLTVGEETLSFSRTETRAAFFKAINENNTINILLTGLYNKSGEGETPAYVPVSWNQKIDNVKAGQWRKISIKILHASDGNVQLQITVETWVYDQKIDVDIMSSSYSFGEEVIPDEETSDKNSPVITLDNGHNIAQPFRITNNIFDFDIQSCSDMISTIATPQAGSTIASLQVVFDSDNAALLEALATAGYTKHTVALWPGENPAKDYCVVKTSGSNLLVKVNYAGMKGFYDFPGTHTAKLIAIDTEGRRSYTTMTIVVSHESGSEEGPGIIWNDGKGTTFDFGIRHTLTEEGMPAIIDFTSESGITGLIVEIISDELTAEVLEGLELATRMDLVNPATDAMNDALIGLGFKTKDEVAGQNTLQFDITQFMPLLFSIAPGNTDFKLTVTDASGTNVKSIMLYVPSN